jgi:hypothetical protein
MLQVTDLRLHNEYFITIVKSLYNEALIGILNELWNGGARGDFAIEREDF